MSEDSDDPAGFSPAGFSPVEISPVEFSPVEFSPVEISPVGIERTPAGPPTRTNPRRARALALRELIAEARRQLDADGLDGLSIRSVARALGLASSAVYRYVSGRDELMVLLLVECHNAMANIVEQADISAAAGGGDPGARWLAVCRAVRAWADRSPHGFRLLFGTQLPGRRYPPELRPTGFRIWRVVIGIVDAAITSGSLHPPESPFDIEGLLSPSVISFVGEPSGPPYSDITVRTLALFTSMVGTVASDVFGHLTGFSTLPDRVFDLIVATVAEGVGLDMTAAVSAD